MSTADTETVKAFGRELFEALLPSEVRSRYRTSLNKARDEGKGLRLRLRIEAPELAALPWEYLYDEDEGDYVSLHGNKHLLAATQLGRLLDGHRSMRLAVLNSCEGARTSETNLFSSTGAVLIRRGIPAVVSMQYEITDRAALEFSRTFYNVLAEGLPVDEAVKEARKSISFALSDRAEWGTPVLHMRAPDGRLFDIDVASALFPGARDETSPDEPQRPPPADDDARRGLPILLRKVKQFWVDGVLKQSLHRSTLIELGLDAMPAMVDSPWGSLPMTPDQTISGVFEEMGGSLLILGEPGSGKTTMMLTLARDLLAHAEADPSRAVPVVFNLSSWASTGGPLAEHVILSRRRRICHLLTPGSECLKRRRFIQILRSA